MHMPFTCMRATQEGDTSASWGGGGSMYMVLRVQTVFRGVRPWRADHMHLFLSSHLCRAFAVSGDSQRGLHHSSWSVAADRSRDSRLVSTRGCTYAVSSSHRCPVDHTQTQPHFGATVPQNRPTTVEADAQIFRGLGNGPLTQQAIHTAYRPRPRPPRGKPDCRPRQPRGKPDCRTHPP